MKKIIVCLFAAAAVLGACSPFLFSEVKDENIFFMDIPPVVVASKVPETILEVSGTVYVITEEDIKRYGWRDLKEILKAIPNMDLM